MAPKKRAKWWIVSTHILTTGFVMPLLASIVGRIVIGASGARDLGALVLFLALQAIGYIGGAYYSLNYLRKQALTDDWVGCIKPTIITFLVLALLGLAANIIFVRGDIPAAVLIIVYYLIVVRSFIKITADGFRSFQSEPGRAGR